MMKKKQITADQIETKDKYLSDDIAEKIGKELISLLSLKVKSNGRVDTSEGDKSPIGLARTAQRVFNEKEESIVEREELLNALLYCIKYFETYKPANCGIDSDSACTPYWEAVQTYEKITGKKWRQSCI